MASSGEGGGANPSPLMTPAEVNRCINNAFADNLVIRGIKKFDGTRGQEALRWMETFDDESMLRKWTDQDKVDKFKSLMTGNALDWYKVAVEAGRAVADYADLKNRFMTFYEVKIKFDL